MIQLDKHHIVLYAVVALLALFGVYLVESKVAARAEDKVSAADARAQLIQQQNTQFQASIQSQLTALANQNSQLAVENAQLTAAVTARNNELAKQQAAIPAMTQDAVASEIAAKLKLSTGDILSTQTGSYSVTRPAANAILGSIQASAVLTRNLTDATSQIGNLDAALKNDEQALQLEKKSHESDLTSCKTDVTAAKAETKVAVAKARKNWLKGFFVGLVAGFVGGRAV